MKCLEGYISVGNNCITTTSLSGKYLTDLPGVSLLNIDAVANDNQLSFVGVFADVEKRAISRITKDILAFMKSQYNLKKSIYTYSTVGEIKGFVPYDGNFHGINVYCLYEYSPLLRLHLNKVYLYALEANETTIYYGTDVTNLTETVTITTTVGWNEIFINKSFESTNLYVIYDGNKFTNIPNFILTNDICDCLYQESDCYTLENRAVTCNMGMVNYGTNSFGLKLDVSLRCAYESIVCANIDIYADAYLYALGMELMRERLYSDRVNKYTSVDRNKAKELLELFTQDYTDFLATANNTVQLNDDSCVECLEASGFKWVMP